MKTLHEITIAAVLAILFAPFGEWVLRGYRRFRLQLLLRTRFRHERIRVSCAAILLVKADDAMILMRTLRRNESFGPFGGAIKYTLAGRAFLTQMGFEPQSLGTAVAHGIVNDLRGFMPSQNLIDFLEWFDKGEHRESDLECLRRELREELSEVGLSKLTSLVDNLEFNFVRMVIEGPTRRPGDGLCQIRVFRVHELHLEDQATREFQSAIIESARTNQNLCRATVSQIRMGRSEGKPIGQHAGYLVGSRQLRPEPSPFDM